MIIAIIILTVIIKQIYSLWLLYHHMIIVIIIIIFIVITEQIYSLWLL